MLLEMAVGDAYGIGFEFCQNPSPNDLSQFYQHPKYSNLIPGQYTDDTQRALANTMVICSKDYLNPLDYATAYVTEFKTSPRDGYSRGFQALIESCSNGVELLNKVNPTASSNGSIMGVAPLGYIEQLQDVKRAAIIQATVTHSWETAPWAQMIALMSHYFLYDIGPKAELINFLNLEVQWPASMSVRYENPAYMFSPIIKSGDNLFKCTMNASDTALHILYAILNYDNLQDMLKHCVNVGGDTDSLAASAMAIGSVSKEIENNLPQHLFDALENGSRGRDYIANLDNVINNVYFPNTWIAQAQKN